MSGGAPVLPIDEHVAAIAAAAFASGAVVVAPPGAGKSTRVPPALMAARRRSGAVLVLQPRRLAARMLAVRVAEELGAVLGAEVGYEVRFERRARDDSRIVFMTTGVFLRRVARDPELAGVAAVVIDELHERTIEADLALALVREVRRRHPGLGLVAMSATMDPQPVASYLDGAAIIETRGRSYPVEVSYLPGESDWPLEKKVSAAVRELLRGGIDGNVLVFLPGKREIERCAAALAPTAEAAGLMLAPLHGQLPPHEQDRAVRSRERRIVLATNVAETSVTIDDVAHVVDSGLVRMARASGRAGMTRLTVVPVSRASADQRAGRAGRTRPGTCIRLTTREDYSMRPAETVPEVRRVDLSPALLELVALGVPDLEWLESPPPGAWADAKALLERLDLVAGGAITASGRAAHALPTHPRLARVVEIGIASGVGRSACAAAAVIEAGPLRAGAAAVAGDSDVVADTDALGALAGMPAREARRAGASPRAVAEARRLCDQLVRSAGAPPDDELPDAERDRRVRFALCAGFLDRVARRRQPDRRELAMAGVARAALSESSVVRGAELVVAVDAAELGRAGGRRVEVSCASAIELDWLIELDADHFDDEDVHEVDGDRVVRVRRLVYDGLVVDERRTTGDLDVDACARALLATLPEPRWHACADRDEIERLRLRLGVAGAGDRIDDGALEQAFVLAAAGATRVSELEGIRLAPLVMSGLEPEVRSRLERSAPDAIALPGRRRVRVHYHPEREPWIESRLQDFFGLRELPRVGAARVVAHLLAPNQRAVQVTRDLQRFWTEHYPALRRQLLRRYPRHSWPEDPLSGVG